mmetsp:Transcript_93592/g.166511  ORF Transcript_93592/g.166511 Transcript_93592/m.166511 type:complete len:546 (+) Transcript_93592:85-1722(+)
MHLRSTEGSSRPVATPRCRGTSRYRQGSRLERGACHASAKYAADAKRLLQGLEASQDRESLRGRLADVLAVMGDSPQAAKTLAAAGGMTSAASIAARAPHDRPIQLYVLHMILALAAEHKKMAQGAEGNLPASAAMVTASAVTTAADNFADGKVQRMVCEALTALAGCGPDAAAAAMQAGGGATVLALGLENAGTARLDLLKTALHTSRAFTEAGAGIPSEGVGELVAALRRHAQPGLQAAACAALRAQLAASPAAMELALTEGAFEAALTAAEASPHHRQLQIAACGLLADITDASEAASVNHRRGPGQAGVPAVAAANAAAAALRAFLAFGDGSCREADELCQAFTRISKKLPMEALVGIVNHERCTALPQHWVAGLKLAKGNLELQRLLCEASHRLIHEGLGPSLVEAGAGAAVVQAMQDWVYDPGLQRAACEALAGIAWCDGKHAAAAGGVETAAQALRIHQAYAWVCIPALDALAAQLLKSQERSGQTCSSPSSCWDPVAGALRRHRSSHRVVRAATRVLQLLAGGEEAIAAAAGPPPGF